MGAAELGFVYLGSAKLDALAAVRKEPGTLAERRWEGVAFKLPESGLAGCWWLTNPVRGAEERGPQKEAPRFLCKSLAILVAELHQIRVATVGKMSEKPRARLQRNQELMGQL